MAATATTQPRARGWAFTLNNYTPEEEAHLKSLTKGGKPAIDCMICGYEVGEQKATPHIQGYIRFSNVVNRETCKKVIGSTRVHVEKQEYSAAKNWAYASKNGNICHKIGELPQQGQRKDVEEVRDAILKEGKCVPDILEGHPHLLRFAENLMKYVPTPPVIQGGGRDVTWIWGPTGVGKSKMACETIGANDYWISMGRNLRWWDGYWGQDWAWIDEFRADFCTFHELLRLLDRYPVRVEVKCSSVWMTAHHIIITSSRPPTEVYEHRCAEDIRQLLRRITRIIEVEPDTAASPAETQNTEVDIRNSGICQLPKDDVVSYSTALCNEVDEFLLRRT
nr:MAG: replication associated protein [Arizlama virus]